MARAVRIEFPGAIYHITSRGNSRQEIFLDSQDFEDFLGRLDTTAQNLNWLVYAYCLMPNHYHLLLETQEPNLSKGMRYLNSGYCQAFNRRHGRSGHVVQGRYHAILVERETYLLEVSRYIVLNPVRAGLVDSPEKWKWSSFRATAGKSPSLETLATRPILSHFSKRLSLARKAYESFVRDGLGKISPLMDVRHEVILGSDAYIQKLTPLFKSRHFVKRFPRIQRYATRPSLEAILGIPKRDPADRARILEAVKEHGYTLKEIAHFLGVHPTTVGRIIKPRRR